MNFLTWLFCFNSKTIAFQAGSILLCLGCAIFGITEVPTDGVEFDTGEFGGESNSESVAPTQVAQQGSNYTPPENNVAQAGQDVETGKVPPSSQESQTLPSPVTVAPPRTESGTAVDLLDDFQAGKQVSSSAADVTIDELD